MRHIAHDRWRRWPRSQWVQYCDPDCFVVTRMGKVDGVRRDGGVNVPCRGRKQDSVQAATPAMCGEILRVSVWRMCQNRVPIPGWLGRTSPHTIVEVAQKDAQVSQLCKPCVQLFTLVPRKWSWMLAMTYGVWPGRASLMARAWLPMEGSLETYLDMELWTRNCVSGFSSP